MSLVKHFSLPEANINIWLDDATQNRLLHELPYEVSQLAPEDRFFFFYAGHGFFSKGTNRLTTWDSHPLNFDGTTVGVHIKFDLDARSQIKAFGGDKPYAYAHSGFPRASEYSAHRQVHSDQP